MYRSTTFLRINGKSIAKPILYQRSHSTARALDRHQQKTRSIWLKYEHFGGSIGVTKNDKDAIVAVSKIRQILEVNQARHRCVAIRLFLKSIVPPGLPSISPGKGFSQADNRFSIVSKIRRRHN
jgi:hypothetical protein